MKLYHFSCIIKIKEDISLTIRLELSAENVNFLFKCIREDGRIYKTEFCTDNIVVPIINLHHIEKTLSLHSNEDEANYSQQSISNKDESAEEHFTTYYVTAEIMYSNWPLNLEEWRTVDAYKYLSLLKPLTERLTIALMVKKIITI